MKIKSAFVKDTAILTSGIIVAQFVPLVAYPLLSRIYTPADFGILSVLTSITAILAIIASFNYENAVLITKTSRLGAELIMVTQYLALLFLCVTSIFTLPFNHQIAAILNAPQIADWLWTCPICAYCIVLFNCYNEWCVKQAQFKSLSLNKIINGGALPLGKIIFTFAKSSGLIIGELFGHIVTGLSCVIRVFRSDKVFFSKPSALHMRYLLKRYIDCPKYVLPSRLFNKIGLEVPIFLIMSYYSAEELGYYSMAATLLVLPTKVIGKAITDTFRQKANEMVKQSGNCSKFYKKVFFTLLFFSVICFSVIYAVAPELFSFVLGEKWTASGHYSRILCFASAISLITDFGSALYYIKERMDILLGWQILYFALTSISMLVGVFVFGDIISTLWCLVTGRIIAYSTNGVFTYHLSK